MVNNLNNANQAQAMIAAEGTMSVSTLAHDLDRVDEQKEVKKTDLMEKLLEVGGSKDLSAQLLKDLMTKVAQAGITFGKTAPQSEIEEKRDQTKEGEFADKVQVSSKEDKEANLPIQGIGRSRARFEGSKEQIASEWEEIKGKLAGEGKSTEEISRLEQQFKTSEMRKYMFNLLKDSAILYYLDSDNKLRELIRQRGFSDLIEKSSKELAKEAAVEAQAEVKSFTLHELENQLITRTFLQDGDFKEAYRLVDIGKKVGLDTVAWMDKVWPDKKADHGLNLLDVPHEVTCFVNLRDDNPDARKERAKYDYKDEDEKDVMLNRLRACYLQMALRPGAVESIRTWFKMRSLKNGLIRLGVYTQELVEKTREGAIILAKVKTMEVLDEALHERASLFDPSKDSLVENKIKNCMKNLERLGFNLDEKDFIAMRDKANRHVYELIQNEMESVKSKSDPSAEKKGQQLQKLLYRLQKESNLSLKEEA